MARCSRTQSRWPGSCSIGLVPGPPGWMRTSRAGASSIEWCAPSTRVLAPTTGAPSGERQKASQPSSGCCWVQVESTSQGPTASSSSTPSKRRRPICGAAAACRVVGHGVGAGGSCMACLLAWSSGRRSADGARRTVSASRLGPSSPRSKRRVRPRIGGSRERVRSSRAGRPRAGAAAPGSARRAGATRVRRERWSCAASPASGKSALLDELVARRGRRHRAAHPGSRGRGAAGVRGAAPPAAPADPAARRTARPSGAGAAGGVRRGGRALGRAVPGGRGDPVAADDRGRGEPGAVRRRRRTLAGPGHGGCPAVLRPPARCGPGRHGVRRPGRRLGRASTRRASPSWS